MREESRLEVSLREGSTHGEGERAATLKKCIGATEEPHKLCFSVKPLLSQIKDRLCWIQAPTPKKEKKMNRKKNLKM